MNFIIYSFIIILSLISTAFIGAFNFTTHNLKDYNINIFFKDLTNPEELLIYKNDSINGLKLLNNIDTKIIFDIRYASKNNFTNKVLYDADACILHENTLKKLLMAQEDFRKLGYNLKIWDAYRPYYVQKELWEILPNNNYIANPYINGSNHNRGCAVDVTLTDINGFEIEMPTLFDEFTENAHRSYPNASKIQIDNSELLKEIMIKNGFKPIFTEWWHFDDKEYANYPILNIKLSEFLYILNNNNKRR